MKVFIERTKEEHELQFSGTVRQLLNELKINPEVVLVSRNNELLTDTDKVTGKDSIKILSVVSGG